MIEGYQLANALSVLTPMVENVYFLRPTLCVMPCIAVKISCLYKCMQKSTSSSNAKFLNMPHPALFDSSAESVIVCSSNMRTMCSRNNSFLHFVSSIIFAIATAAEVRFFDSGLVKSLIMGRICFSRMAASSGSVGGLTGFAIGLTRPFTRSLCLDLPITVSRRRT